LLATIFENATLESADLLSEPFATRVLLTAAFDKTLLVAPFATRVLLTVVLFAITFEATAFVAVLDVSGLALLATMACLVAARLLIKDFFSIFLSPELANTITYCSLRANQRAEAKSLIPKLKENESHFQIRLDSSNGLKINCTTVNN
jgi:hypothetical protein